MAVYTRLTDGQIADYATAFGLGTLVRADGIAQGTINSVYDVHTTHGRFILRILEDRPAEDVAFESQLVACLHGAGLRVPRMHATAAGDWFVSLSSRQHISFFDFLPGVEPARCDVSARYARQVGRFMGEMHGACESLTMRRANPFGPKQVSEILTYCREAPSAPGDVVTLDGLRDAVSAFSWPEDLPMGVVHGDLFVDNTRFSEEALCGVFDFEMASSGPLVFDLAVAIADWGFCNGDTVLDLGCARELVLGYQEHRLLTSAEKLALFGLCSYVTARYTASRYYDFEVRVREDAERQYKDYRVFLSRFQTIKALGAEAFARGVLKSLDAP